MASNDRSLTNQKDGLGNLLNLTNQDFYVRLVDEKNKDDNFMSLVLEGVSIAE